jgi:hypothetical protein
MQSVDRRNSSAAATTSPIRLLIFTIHGCEVLGANEGRQKSRPVAQFEVERCAGDYAWDAGLLELGDAHPYQSSAFGELERMAGKDVRYVAMLEGDEVVARCSFLCDERGAATWFYGPVVSGESLQRYGEIVEAMLRFLRKEGVRWVENAMLSAIYREGFYRGELERFRGPLETPYVDLTKEWGEIEGGFSSALRKNVRKAASAGVEVSIDRGPNQLEIYLTMLNEDRDRMGFPLPPLHPNAESMQMFARPSLGMDVGLACLEGEPLAGLGFVTFGGVVVEIAAARSARGRASSLPANELLKVTAFEHYKSRGSRIYDITGVRRVSPGPKESGIRRFKLKFTQSVADLGHIELAVFDQLRYARYRMARKLRSTITRS